MTAINVWIVGFGPSAGKVRESVNTILQTTKDAHGSVTTIVDADVKCAEHSEKDEPYLRVCSDDLEGAKRVAHEIFMALEFATEYAQIAGVFVPEE